MRVSRSVFAVLAAGGALHVALADLPAFPSPLEPTGQPSGAFFTPLALHDADVGALDRGGEFEIVGLPLSATETITVRVQRIEPFAADAVIVNMTQTGPVRVLLPEMLVLGGEISGQANSRVVLAFSPAGFNGLVQTDAEMFVYSSGAAGSGLPIMVSRIDAASAPQLNIRPFVCGADLLPDRGVVSTGSQSGGASAARGAPCRVATVALETDNEFLTSFGGSPAVAAGYAGTLIGAVSEIFARDFNTRLQIGFLRIWSVPDPWTLGDAIDQLFEFQDYWNLNETGIARNAAHFLTTRQLARAGGVAYLPGLCQQDYDYGLSAYLNGFFPYPIVNNDGQNWDLMVVAHELGHNFGAPHTHDMTPPVDGCAFGDCSVVPNGTIMSYCHICSGGMANVRMEVHSRSVTEHILPYLNTEAPCNIVPAAIQFTSQPQAANVCPGAPLTLSASATGGGTLSYQWRRNGVDIPGANGTSYFIPAFVAAMHMGVYDIEVSNQCSSLVSSGAVVTECPVPGDINGSCDVDIADLSILLSNFGTASGATYSDGDLTGDGAVDLGDLALMLSDFGNPGC